MALPSSVTLGSAALVVVAGIGLGVVSSQASDQPSHEAAPNSTSTDPIGRPGVGTSTDPIGRPGVGTGQQTGSRQPATRSQRPEHKPRQPSNVIPKTLVVVYNNSGLAGLAADRAAFLQGAGWNVAGTDNWYGDIVANTVYYPPKLKSEAQRLAKALHISRVMPTVNPMQFDRLTVIFTSG